jgi:hypothetical protein
MRAEAPPAFASADEAAAALSAFAASFEYPCVDLSPEAIAAASAEIPWIKALARKRGGEAGFYGRWAGEAVPRMVKSARYVINQEQFDILVRRTGLDLLRYWRGVASERRPKLPFGAAFRVVDLLFAAINESEQCRFGSVRSFLHVPLDAATLRPLRLCIDELVDRDFAIEISATVPTGFVATEEQYELLQGAISTLADRAGVAPIAYAYFCSDS